MRNSLKILFAASVIVSMPACVNLIPPDVTYGDSNDYIFGNEVGVYSSHNRRLFGIIDVQAQQLNGSVRNANISAFGFTLREDGNLYASDIRIGGIFD